MLALDAELRAVGPGGRLLAESLNNVLAVHLLRQFMSSRMAEAQGGRELPRQKHRTVLVDISHDLGEANILTVTNLNDGGIGSLRYELALAQDGDTIVCAHKVHGTIAQTSGELQVGHNVTITGPGAGQLTDSGNDASRVFEILGVGSRPAAVFGIHGRGQDTPELVGRRFGRLSHKPEGILPLTIQTDLVSLYQGD
jgi:hypothetical protein